MNGHFATPALVRRSVIAGALLMVLALCAVCQLNSPPRAESLYHRIGDFTSDVVYTAWGEPRGMYVEGESGSEGIFVPYGPVISLYLTLQLPPLIF